jgi:hypothetical protein
MKTRLKSEILLLVFAMAAVTTGLAQRPTAPTELTVTVSESVNRRAEGFATFSAIQSVFTRVFSKRGWPVKINVERFASNNPDHDYELRVFFKQLDYDTPGQLTVRAWMTLFENGKEHDFGILKYQLNQGPIEHHEDAFEAVLRGEAELAAAKIEPILFPRR